ncbi:autotransporter outer membrane beta-barrel domain-containing protein, partial [Salmonella enterica]|nr:autotransporter outer membrane beta-barrel domain-containing protein [Salmonella enterica]EIG9537328.1 autotransporter outer membrane beta-barrel domain-containing protein [Salmonella enterica]EIH0810012.1 autotransporter outer membrane beta-barrel domain-containing protein [Salmonella enterica]EIH2228729.1 autotransporter outer membrane beta-barrel domain-containing protein [Salmonella enterica]EIH3860825.1 autotransporter outer membrane beta-barrel domain-containing protein [Salmonella ent
MKLATTTVIISLMNATYAATEVTIEEHETRLMDQGSSEETHITINGNNHTELKNSTDLYLNNGTYSVYNKNERAKDNWNNLNINHLDHLILTASFPRMTTYDLISGMGADEIEIENGHSVTIGQGTLVRKIWSKEPQESNRIQITNSGSILDLGNIDILNNNGYADITDDIGAINNAVTGHIVVSGDTTGNVLRNYGWMTVLQASALTLVASEVKKAEITNSGVMTLIGPLGMWGDGELRNYGTINITAGGIIGPGGGANTTTEITNAGVIRGQSTVIYVLPDGKGGQGSGSVHIHNAGTIIGDIEDNEKNNYTIVMTNERGGKWSSSFTGHKISDTENGEPKYLTITNNGSISTIKNTGGKSGEIKTKQITNNGEIDIRQGPLTIRGDYHAGTGARIVTGGALLGDETIIPTLTINGSVDGGTTHVRVDNLGGTGSETRDGILVVRADTVDGEGFTKEGRIVAGAYDYDLVRVESGDHTEWRLTSALTPEPPGPVPPVPPGPVPPGPVPPAPVRVVRPEAVTYAENLRQANTLFMTDSEQRRAVGEYTDPVTGRTET